MRMSADSQASHPGSPVPSRPTCVALGIASFLCFVAGFGTGAEFVRFLSFGAIFKNISGGLEDERPLLWRDAVGDASFLRSLGLNVALLIIFVVQHSLMAWPAVKEAVVKVFGVLQRSVYILCTAASLQILMRYWQPFPRGPYLWNVTTAPWSAWLPLLCALLHTVSWLLIIQRPPDLRLRRTDGGQAADAAVITRVQKSSQIVSSVLVQLFLRYMFLGKLHDNWLWPNYNFQLLESFIS
ncbi:unnamed protein product [Ranitomeya imitator]|uniref:Nurim n=1 Tax=Ranitomeya imitator TaxID=111125 RepID=A0ABN9MK16_9NEOB|nr:unnamed protein product [Ranitomeya imitator]